MLTEHEALSLRVAELESRVDRLAGQMEYADRQLPAIWHFLRQVFFRPTTNATGRDAIRGRSFPH